MIYWTLWKSWLLKRQSCKSGKVTVSEWGGLCKYVEMLQAKLKFPIRVPFSDEQKDRVMLCIVDTLSLPYDQLGFASRPLLLSHSHINL